MNSAPKGVRLHIGIFGRRNAGKSSLLNALTGQNVSIVSERAGTTTDPVEKAMELLPLGPVVFIDTAGIDDAGGLGLLRVERSRRVLDRCDAAILVTCSGAWSRFEEELYSELQQRRIPTVVVFNKADRGRASPSLLARLRTDQTRYVETVATENEGTPELRNALLGAAPGDFVKPSKLVGDLIPPGGLVVLVVPIDLEAPRGRLILPQVQAIRDVLDHDAYCMVAKERELGVALARLKGPPDLVVTDSQAFLEVAGRTPPGVPLTSFSILFARFKGDLEALTEGALAIDNLSPGDRVLIAEACTHHPIGEDIGRIKIPRWLAHRVGGRLDISHVQGHDFPADAAGYQLVVHCGACVHNRRELLHRIAQCGEAGVPVTNYGLCIAQSLGLLERALEPFPGILERGRRRAREKERRVPMGSSPPALPP